MGAPPRSWYTRVSLLWDGGESLSKGGAALGLSTLREAVPTVVMHMAAAAVHLMATTGMGGRFPLPYQALLALCLIALPMLAVLITLAGYSRHGHWLLLVGFLGTAGLLFYGHLGQGMLALGLDAGPSPWRTLFFGTAMLLPLLQILGIFEGVRALSSDRLAPMRSRPRTSITK